MRQVEAELEADAIADDVTRGAVQYRSWSGANGGSLQTASNWSSPTAPDRYWSAVVANNGPSAAIAHVATDVTTLGIEVKGQSAMQVVNVHAGRTITGLNEVRVGDHGRIDLAGGTVSSSRWVDIKPGGEIIGNGTIRGDVTIKARYPQGEQTIAELADCGATRAAAESLEHRNGQFVTLDFSGIQDDVPVGQTTTLNQYLQITHGLDFGPSLGPRWTGGGTDAGNELNTMGMTASSLAEAITNGDYITFTVNPVAGAGMIPTSVAFNV